MEKVKLKKTKSNPVFADKKNLSIESPSSAKVPPTMKEQVEKSKYKSNELDLFIGYALILFSFFCFSFGLYSCVISKLVMPKTGN